MSCPDWHRLVELRDQRPEQWDEALGHLDRCASCRDDAYDAEPALLFRRLPSMAASDREIASIKQTVAAMCRTEAIQEPPRRRRNLLRAASLAAAVLAAVHLPGLLLAPGVDDPVASLMPSPTNSLEIDAPVQDGRAGVIPRPAADYIPLVEDVDPAYGSVVQVIDQDISLVLVLPNHDV